MNEKISVLGEPIAKAELTLEELAVENLSESVNIHEVLSWITERHGKFFSIKFVKRTTGEERTMVCRTGVKNRLVPSKNHTPIDHKSYGLISVFDVQKDDYRRVPIEGIKEVKMHGKWIPVTQNPRWTIIGRTIHPLRVLVKDTVLLRRGIINNPSPELYEKAQTGMYPLPESEYANVTE